MARIRFGMSVKRLDDWLAGIESAHELGFEHVELKIDSMDKRILHIEEAFLQKIVNKTQEYNLSVSLHGLDDIVLGTRVDFMRDRIVEALCIQANIAYHLNAKWLTLHLGKYPCKNNSTTKEQCIELVLCTLRQLLIEIREFHVTVAIENLPYKPRGYGNCYVGDTLNELILIQNGVEGSDRDHQIKLICDVGHAIVNSHTRSNIIRDIRRYRENIVAMHFHINDHKRDLHKGLNKVYLKRNEIFLRELLELMGQMEAVVLEMGIDEAIVTRCLLNSLLNIDEG